MNQREEERAARIEQILPWARLAGSLTASWRPHEHGLHLRPSGTGIRVIDLSPARPQLDRGKISSRTDAVERFKQIVATSTGATLKRATPEKRLQSWLISEAYRHDRVMVSLSDQLTFVTDEQVFPADGARIVCDMLALRKVREGAVPVAIELKSRREMTRLEAQLDAIASIVDTHRTGFEQLFSAVLAKDVRLVGPCERWLVWPATSQATDPRAAELTQRGVVVRGYREDRGRYSIA